MDKGRAIIVIVFMFLCLCFTVTVTNSNIYEEEEEEQKQQDPKARATSFWLWQQLKSFYSLYSKVGSPTTWSWQMFKQAYSLFIAPALGFSSKGGDEALRAEKEAANSGNERKTTSSEQESQRQNEL